MYLRGFKELINFTKKVIIIINFQAQRRHLILIDFKPLAVFK